MEQGMWFSEDGKNKRHNKKTSKERPVFPAQNEITLSRRSKEREHIQQKINQSVKFRNS